MTNNLGPIVFDLNGLELSKDEERLITHPLVGGIIIFSRNYANPEQLDALIQHIRSIRSELILCVDQEGGRVQRLQNQFTRLPHMSMLGALWDSGRFSEEKTFEFCTKLGFLMALEVRAIGLDLSFAPVLDIDKGVSEIMRDRAIHQDPDIVVDLASAYIKGMNLAGMKATGKHFPGHGHVKADSHLELPVDTRSLNAIKADMLPFKALSNQLDAMMTAHILFSEIDVVPATFSRIWLKEILRNQLGFQGAIISDDLTMNGATGMGNYVERSQRALEAGCDMLLICNNRAGVLEALESVVDIADELTYSRRSKLRATEAVPSWQELKHYQPWQEAYSAFKEGAIELNTEKT